MKCLEPPSSESATTVRGVNYKLLAIMLLKYQNRQILVVVDRSSYGQWRQESVDPIDPHPLQGSPT